jgi:hypothetical protein
MKIIPSHDALVRVSKRQPYASHWGQRRLGFNSSWLRGFADSLGELRADLLVFFAFTAAILALLPLYMPHGSPQWVVLISSTLAFLACVILLRALAWSLVSQPVRLEQVESIQAWMLDHSTLADAAAHWLRPGEVLRQRDYTLLKWAHDCIQEDKRKTAAQTIHAAGDHPLLFWTKRSLDLIKQLGGNACATLPSNMPIKQQQLVALTTQLSNAHYPEHITLTYKQGDVVSELHYSKYLRGKGMQSLFTHPTLSGFGEAIGASLLISSMGGVFLFLVITLVFRSDSGLQTYASIGNVIAWIAAIGLTAALITSIAREMIWAMGSAPLSPIACHKLGELAKDHPLAANLFFAHIPSGRYLTYDHFQIFWKMVMTTRAYERSIKEQKATGALAAALESLPAARISRARENARLLDENTVGASTQSTTRRL